MSSPVFGWPTKTIVTAASSVSASSYPLRAARSAVDEPSVAINTRPYTGPSAPAEDAPEIRRTSRGERERQAGAPPVPARTSCRGRPLTTTSPTSCPSANAINASAGTPARASPETCAHARRLGLLHRRGHDLLRVRRPLEREPDDQLRATPAMASADATEPAACADAEPSVPNTIRLYAIVSGLLVRAATIPWVPMNDRVFNFAAGPATLPLPVLEQAQRDLVSLPGVGASPLEVSHRSPWFEGVIGEADANLRALLAIPDSHHVVFCQGGATLQFSMVPMNLLRGSSGRAPT